MSLDRPPCAGKTTLALRLATERTALCLSPDEWHVGLFGQDYGHSKHFERHDMIETKLVELAFRCLGLGTSVILDFGFWSREEREDIRARASDAGVASELHYVTCAEPELLARLAARNERPNSRTFVLPAQAVIELAKMFEVPTADELKPRSA